MDSEVMLESQSSRSDSPRAQIVHKDRCRGLSREIEMKGRIEE